MKFSMSILCLFVTSFVIFGKAVEYDNAARWKQELAKFKTGLKMTNDQGKLVDLTLSPVPITGSGRTFGGEVIFYLYNNKNGSSATEFKYDLSELTPDVYDLSAPTVFITHGWISNSSSKACTLIRDAYLKKGGFNVVVVDWSSISNNLYEIAVSQVHDVGVIVADMINQLAEANYLRIEDTILVGHSLGAHVMGIAGYTLGGAVNEIFGLDPAGPLFWFAPVGWRISKGDAKYVEIIHTNAGFLGVDEAIGDADFFVNNGYSQPNCNLDIAFACSHNRAYEVYAESINSDISFWGQEYDSNDKIAGIMGGTEVNPNVTGKFEVPTNDSPPYALGDSISNVHL